MTDIATLKVQVRADGTAKVTGDLDRLGKTSDRLSKKAQSTSKAFLGLQGTMKKVAIGLGGLVGFSSLTAVLGSATKQAMAFEAAMAEVSTLSNTIDMSQLTEEVKRLSGEFGSDKITQAKALYQVISAGASTAAEASRTLAVANKLAVGGVTDVATAADGLTSALNAYGKTAEEAELTSDAFFVAMKAGKTTIGELAASIGNVAPIASQAGMSLEELLAATAAVTKTGLNTRMTMNSLRQAIASMLKPTTEATETAERLGIQFDSAALKSKGFTAILKEVMDVTKGNAAELTKLFGSVESMGSVMALVSESGAKDYAEILLQMEQRAGATNEAFEKISKTSRFLAGVLREKLKTVILELGMTFLERLNPVLLYTTTNFDALKHSAETLGKVLLTGALMKGLTMLPGLLQTVIGLTGMATTSFMKLTAVMLMNPFGLIAAAVVGVASALIVFRNETVSVMGVTGTVTEFVVAAWEWTSKAVNQYFKAMGINLAGVWDGLVVSTKSSLKVVSRALSGWADEAPLIIKAMANRGIALFVMLGKGIGITIAGMVTNFKNFGAAVMKIFSSLWAGIQAVFRGDFDFTQLKSTLEQELMEPAAQIGDAYKEAWEQVSGEDYIGDIQQAGREIADLVSEAQRYEEATREVVVQAKRWGEETSTTAGQVATLSSSTGAAALSAKELEKAMELAGDEMSGPFSKALQNTVERIDEAFVEAWKGAYNSFNDFADGIIDAFKQLLAEMAHIAITRPIVMSIGASMGLGSANATAGGMGLMDSISAAGGLSGFVKGGVTSAFNAFSGAAGNFYQGAGTFMASGGMGDAFVGMGQSGISQGAAYQAGGMTAFKQMGANIAAGVIGAFAANKIFGETSGIGSGVGGLAGSFFGPWGTMAGSFLGGGVEKVLGNVFGFGSKGQNQAGAAEFDLATGSINAYGIGKKFDQENVDAAQSLAQTLQMFSEVIGGSDFEGRLKVGNKSGIKLDGQAFKTAEELFRFTFDEIVNSATNLSDGLKRVIKDFDGTSEEIMVFAASMVSLTDMIKNNPVDQAMEDFAAAQDAASMTMTDAYAEQLQYIDELVNTYDGSAEAAAQLALAMGETQTMAYQLTIAILQVGEAIGTMAENSARSIRESMLTEEQLVESRKAERDVTMDLLLNSVDPAEILKYAQVLDEINNFLFGKLTDTEKHLLAADRPDLTADPNAAYAEGTSVGETYALAAENIATIADQQLKLAAESIAESQAAMNAGVEELLDNAAKANQAAADTMEGAANSFGAWVQHLVNNGITVNVALPQSEVNV